jgi:hypothetical protein
MPLTNSFASVASCVGTNTESRAPASESFALVAPPLHPPAIINRTSARQPDVVLNRITAPSFRSGFCPAPGPRFRFVHRRTRWTMVGTIPSVAIMKDLVLPRPSLELHQEDRFHL